MTLDTSLPNGANYNIYQGKKNSGILIMLREKKMVLFDVVFVHMEKLEAFSFSGQLLL